MIDRGSITVLAPNDTHDLRLRVLRDGSPDANLRWAGDDDLTTEHLGIVLEGEVVAISTWLSRRPATQLRGMATEPTHAGHGFGRRLLQEGIRRAAERGDELVWANARIGARRFYERAGFNTVGAPFTLPEVDVVHYRVEFPISRPSS